MFIVNTAQYLNILPKTAAAGGFRWPARRIRWHLF
jgi:hypothetical protein